MTGNFRVDEKSTTNNTKEWKSVSNTKRRNEEHMSAGKRGKDR